MGFRKIIVSLALVATIISGVSGVSAMNMIDTSTETWNMGVGNNFYICYWQYSNYWNKTKRHYGNAMMNDKYSGRIWANANKWAKADSPESWGDYDTHKSWYDYE